MFIKILALSLSFIVISTCLIVLSCRTAHFRKSPSAPHEELFNGTTCNATWRHLDNHTAAACTLCAQQRRHGDTMTMRRQRCFFMNALTPQTSRLGEGPIVLREGVSNYNGTSGCPKFQLQGWQAKSPPCQGQKSQGLFCHEMDAVAVICTRLQKATLCTVMTHTGIFVKAIMLIMLLLG